MQVHLFDYKSTEPLISGLAGNRLQLCMLVLSKLRDTYWSAGVMHRLFERAQCILQESKRSNPGTASGLVQGSGQVGTHPGNQQTSDAQNQPQKDNNVHILDCMSEVLPLMSSANDMPPFWDDPLSFDTVDELLGPSFGLPEDAFEGLFPNLYGNSAQVLNPVTQLHNGLSQSIWPIPLNDEEERLT